VRWDVGVEYALGLLVSIGMLGYLILAMLRPEKF
jgi:K+-transporting ATPase KdpF subunit